jgi:hypothetical protein
MFSGLLASTFNKFHLQTCYGFFRAGYKEFGTLLITDGTSPINSCVTGEWMRELPQLPSFQAKISRP